MLSYKEHIMAEDSSCVTIITQRITPFFSSSFFSLYLAGVSVLWHSPSLGVLIDVNVLWHRPSLGVLVGVNVLWHNKNVVVLASVNVLWHSSSVSVPLVSMWHSSILDVLASVNVLWHLLCLLCLLYGLLGLNAVIILSLYSNAVITWRCFSFWLARPLLAC